MSAVPAKKPRSAAQVAAGKEFAAAGRAAQAKARAKGKKPSAAQHKAAQKWASAGRAAQAARRAGKKVPVKAVRRAAAFTRFADHPGSPAYWLGACDTEYPACPVIAVANHLLAATGIAMTEKEILALYQLADGSDDGVVISHLLETIHGHTLEFSGGSVRLAGFCQVDENLILNGYIVGLRLPHVGHAVVAHPGGMVSWGQVMPWEGVAEEAWAVEWEPG